MSSAVNPAAPAVAAAPSALPGTIPVFPLLGVVLPPRGRLPLNVFEPRYLALVEDALAAGRLIGLIQPTASEEQTPVPPLYQIGCAGRITSFTETEDGRFLISLQGICRFQVAEELPQRRGYRVVKADWQKFLGDVGPAEEFEFDRARLVGVLRHYFKVQGIAADWGAIQNTTNEMLVSSLTMICPLACSEKQALLEAPDVKARAALLTTLLEMACAGQNETEGARH